MKRIDKVTLQFEIEEQRKGDALKEINEDLRKQIELVDDLEKQKRAQRIYPVGKAWLIKNKVLPLQHESYPTAACHPSRCADRQL